MQKRTDEDIKQEAEQLHGQISMYRAELAALEKKGRDIYDDSDGQILGVRRKMASLLLHQRALGEEMKKRIPKDNRVEDLSDRRDRKC
ncbi:MAG: hypothetical protein NMNS01_23380 [Nitrosomonas sp.]|nr:MAG: hypothetical protein NMNS01_23380 [Nitrosomonas sp.]